MGCGGPAIFHPDITTSCDFKHHQHSERMNTNRTCGCKSFRTCVLCESEYGLKPWDYGQKLKDENRTLYEFSVESSECLACESSSKVLDGFSGIKLIPEFISENEQRELVDNLDQLPWDISQSGRRKQNFGPKANFKKRKAKVGQFNGFPKCTEFIQRRFASVDQLEGYRTVEQCSIEYRPETGACIEPHIDDCWIWGERIVQLNLLSDSCLTLTPYQGDTSKYNLEDVARYPKVLDKAEQVILNPLAGKLHGERYSVSGALADANIVVRVPLPARSLLLMSGVARYEMEHSVLREDITDRRLVLAYRELTPPYLSSGEHEALGAEILARAEHFW